MPFSCNPAVNGCKTVLSASLNSVASKSGCVESNAIRGTVILKSRCNARYRISIRSLTLSADRRSDRRSICSDVMNVTRHFSNSHNLNGRLPPNWEANQSGVFL